MGEKGTIEGIIMAAENGFSTMQSVDVSVRQSADPSDLEWVSVKDKMPPCERMEDGGKELRIVLVVIKDERELFPYRFAAYDDLNRQWYLIETRLHGVYATTLSNEVTHWAELPKLPKEA